MARKRRDRGQSITAPGVVRVRAGCAVSRSAGQVRRPALTPYRVATRWPAHPLGRCAPPDGCAEDPVAGLSRPKLAGFPPTSCRRPADVGDWRMTRGAPHGCLRSVLRWKELPVAWFAPGVVALARTPALPVAMTEVPRVGPAGASRVVGDPAVRAAVTSAGIALAVAPQAIQPSGRPTRQRRRTTAIRCCRTSMFCFGQSSLDYR